MAGAAEGDTRVTLLIVTPWPLASHGGAQRVAQGLASSLTDAGLGIVVAAGSGALGAPQVAVRPPPIREIRLSLVPIESRRWPWQRQGSLAGARLQNLEALGKEVAPGAVLYVSHASSCAEQTAALAESLGVPFVLLPAIHLDQPLHTGRPARRLYRSAALILCLSAIERDWLVHRVGVPPDRILTIGCGWDGTVAREVRPWRSVEPLRLLTVGAFAWHKRLGDQLEAIAALRRDHGLDARLTVVGTLRDHAVLEHLSRLARQRRIDDAVRFLPDCEDAAIAAEHAASHLFLFTSRSESFGVAVLDAIGLGTWPVVYPHPVYRGPVETSGFGTVARWSTRRALTEAVLSSLTVPADACEEVRVRWLAAQSWDHLAVPFATWCASLGHA
jgi:glycosyltransferase involved in cell wall biosynthesis